MMDSEKARAVAESKVGSVLKRSDGRWAFGGVGLDGKAFDFEDGSGWATRADADRERTKHVRGLANMIAEDLLPERGHE